MVIKERFHPEGEDNQKQTNSGWETWLKMNYTDPLRVEYNKMWFMYGVFFFALFMRQSVEYGPYMGTWFGREGLSIIVWPLAVAVFEQNMCLFSAYCHPRVEPPPQSSHPMHFLHYFHYSLLSTPSKQRFPMLHLPFTWGKPNVAAFSKTNNEQDLTCFYLLILKFQLPLCPLWRKE